MIEALYLWNHGGLNVLVPKQRGIGFLRCPLGHHSIPELTDIAHSEGIDIWGLDGVLELDYRYKGLKEQKIITQRVMPKLATYFKFSSWREAGFEEFYSHLI